MSALINFLIQEKTGDAPFVTYNSDVPLTDINTFPYRYYFRGQFLSSDPIVKERHAGWYPNNYLDSAKLSHEATTLRVCFQNPCSTTLRKICE